MEETGTIILIQALVAQWFKVLVSQTSSLGFEYPAGAFYFSLNNLLMVKQLKFKHSHVFIFKVPSPPLLSFNVERLKRRQQVPFLSLWYDLAGI